MEKRGTTISSYLLPSVLLPTDKIFHLDLDINLFDSRSVFGKLDDGRAKFLNIDSFASRQPSCERNMEIKFRNRPKSPPRPGPKLPRAV